MFRYKNIAITRGFVIFDIKYFWFKTETEVEVYHPIHYLGQNC